MQTDTRSAGVTEVYRVGADADDPSVARVLSFTNEFWLALATGAAFEVEVSVTDGFVYVEGDSVAVGYAQPVPSLVRVGDCVGDPDLGDPPLCEPLADPVQLPADPSGIVGLRYVALHAPLSDGSVRITGFAAADILEAAALDDETLALSGLKLASRVALENASAVPALATDPGALLLTDEPLLAPVLAR